MSDGEVSSDSSICDGVKKIPDMKFSELLSDYHIVLQHEFSFQKSSIGTFGISTCVALAGIDAANGVAFVVHFDGLTNIVGSLGLLVYHLNNTYRNTSLSFKVVLVGGSTGSSEQMINDMYNFITQDWVQRKITIEFVGKDILGYECRSIGVNIHTGEFCSVVPMSSPESDSRLKHFMFMNMMRGYEGKSDAKIVNSTDSSEIIPLDADFLTSVDRVCDDIIASYE